MTDTTSMPAVDGTSEQVSGPPPPEASTDAWPEPCDWSWGNEDPNALDWWVVEVPPHAP